MNYTVPTNATLLWRMAIEAIVFLGMGSPMIYIYIYLQGDAQPYRRGFFCDDESLKHPFLPETISVGSCIAIWAAIVIVVVPVVEILIFSIYEYCEWDREMQRRLEANPHSNVARCMANIPWVVIELYRILGYCVLGGLATLLMTELAKYKIGRLRPYFLTVCNLELTVGLCKDKYGYNKFVTDFQCQGDDNDVREAMKSFLSGHSSSSFYFATFLVLYLQARLCSSRLDSGVKRTDRIKLKMILRGFKVLRPFFQFGIFILAIYIAITRISDYRHHPGDVATGIVLGVCNAVLLMVFQIDLIGTPVSFANGPKNNVKALTGSDLELVTHVDGDCGHRGDVSNIENLTRRQKMSPTLTGGDGQRSTPSPVETRPFVGASKGQGRIPRSAEAIRKYGAMQTH